MAIIATRLFEDHRFNQNKYKIEFIRIDESNNQNIVAKISICNKNNEIEKQYEITNIEIDEQSVSEKIKILQYQRQHQIVAELPKPRNISEFSIEKQNRYIKDLEPIGVFKAEFVNNDNNEYISIIIYNPS